MACLLCQLKIPEMLEVFYTKEVMVNLKNFVRPKYCPKLSDIKEVSRHIIFLKFLMQCEKNTNYIFPIFLDNLNNYLINDNEVSRKRKLEKKRLFEDVRNTWRMRTQFRGASNEKLR